jgi:hypothetical protein
MNENPIPNNKPFKPGQSGNPNGRPRKYVSTLREQGYKLSEINDCIQVMMAMTIEELKDAFENPTATVLEKTIAAAIKRSIEKGSLYSIETLLSRVYGKPKESVDMDLSGEVTVTMNLNPTQP